MKFPIPFLTWTGRPPLIVDIPDDTDERWRRRAAIEIAVGRGVCLVGANLDNANLDNANLDNANLDNANLDSARLVGADLVGARLVGARLVGARLDNARLDGACLVGARLDNASLDNARLVGARLVGANLVGARLVGANLTHEQLAQADLRGIESDLYHVLVSARDEVPGLLAALRSGKVDGSTYTGECACLVGTIANIRGVDYEALAPDAARPIERFFLSIREGDTSETNPIAKVAEGWIVKFLGHDPVVAKLREG